MLCVYSFQLFNVGRPARIHNSRCLRKEIRADNRRGDYRQCFCIRLFPIIKTMHCTPWNKTRFAWAKVHCLSIYGKSDHAFNPVNGFVVALVRVRYWNLGSNRNHEFKHGQGTVRVGGFEQEIDSDLPDADDFTFHHDGFYLSAKAKSSLFAPWSAHYRSPAAVQPPFPCNLNTEQDSPFSEKEKSFHFPLRLCASALNHRRPLTNKILKHHPTSKTQPFVPGVITRLIADRNSTSVKGLERQTLFRARRNSCVFSFAMSPVMKINRCDMSGLLAWSRS
ncbi:MAG: hypothetical protein JWR26_4867 [Pedosphaera sp.]|nr:hypothetical protein [Pedosphaera sp.]